MPSTWSLGPNLTGKVALVTGASRGLGAGFATGLARAGAVVAIVARSPKGLARTAAQISEVGGRAVPFAANVTSAEEVSILVDHVHMELGPIDILVNNAGVMAPIGHDWEVDPKEWWHTLEVNVLGCYLCARAVLPGMLERQDGRIINITSSASRKRCPFYSAYGASKAAVTHLTGSLAETTRSHGIAVFALSPGFVRTDMTEALADEPIVRQHLGDGFRRALDEGRHTPLSTAVDALLVLASGAADSLSGEYLDARNNIEEFARLTTIQRAQPV